MTSTDIRKFIVPSSNALLLLPGHLLGLGFGAGGIQISVARERGLWGLGLGLAASRFAVLGCRKQSFLDARCGVGVEAPGLATVVRGWGGEGV